MTSKLLSDAAAVFALRASPDGRAFAFGERERVTVCAMDGTVRWTHRFRAKAPVRGVAFSPDGACLYAGGQAVTVFDAVTGKKQATLKLHKRALRGLDGVPGGLLSWSGESIRPPDDTVRRTDVDGTTPGASEVLAKMESPVVAASLASGGLVAIDDRGRVHADGETRPLEGLRFAETVRAVALIDGGVLVGRGLSVQRHALDGALAATVEVTPLEPLVTRMMEESDQDPTDEDARAQCTEYVLATGYVNALLPVASEVFVGTADGVAVVQLDGGTTREVWSGGTVGCLAPAPEGVLASSATGIWHLRV